VLLEWAEAGEPVDAEFAEGLDALDQEVQAGEIKKMLGGEHDRKNAIVTIHPGAGGTESQDWAEMLLRMYLRWAERRGFKREIIDYQPAEEAGLKSVTFTVNGEYAYGLLSAEAGVHRLVRISPFDQAARRHTSFASLHAWPELPEDVDVVVEDKDIRIDTYRSSGAGGQHVNVTDSAVRITHLPTGLVEAMQDEKSQLQNRVKAMRVLRARLYELEREKQQAELAASRRSQIGTGERAEKIRTYNYPENRVTDHRIKLTLHRLDQVLDGDLGEVTEALRAEEQRQALAAAST
jgi:peptide chain release factor 2